MVAIAISMGLLYGVASMMLFNARAAKSAELSGDFNSLVSTIQTIINNESSCKKVFAGKGFTSTVLGKIEPAISLSSLELNGLKIAEVGLPTTGLKITKIEFDKIENVLPDVTIAGVLNKQYMINLHLEAQKIMSGEVSAIGGSQKTANFKFSILVDLGKVTGCYGDNSITESVSQTCVAMGGTFTNGACNLTPKVNASTVCNASNLGAFRYSATKDSVEYCSSTGWKSVGGALVDGKCNNAVTGGCIAGSPIEDNADSSCSSTRTWKCAGENGGATSPLCSFSNTPCPGGVCGSSAGSCITGTPINDTANNNCGQTRAWNCTTKGGTSGQCTYSNAACPPSADPVPCIGSWSGCSTTCGPGTQKFIITQTAQNNGAACSYADGTTRDCSPANSACPIPAWNESGWSDCMYPKFPYPNGTAWVTCSDAYGAGSQSQTVKCVQGSVVLLDAECLKTAPKPAELRACKNNSGCKTCKNNTCAGGGTVPHGTTAYNSINSTVAATVSATAAPYCSGTQRYVSCPNTTSWNYDGCRDKSSSAPVWYSCDISTQNKMSTCFNGTWGAVKADPSAYTVRYGVGSTPIKAAVTCSPWAP
jgi:hypothetical protein